MPMKDENKNKEHQMLDEKELKDFHQAFEDFKDIMTDQEAGVTVDRGKLAKVEKALDEYCEKSSEMVENIAKAEKENEELKERLNDFEAKMSRMGNGGVKSEDQEKAQQEIKSFEIFLRKGEDNMTPDELKFLRTDDDTQGGFLAPTERIPEIIKKITEMSPLRSVARTSRTSRGSIEIPSRLNLVTSEFVGEGGDSEVSNSDYGMEKITVHHLATTVQTTNTLLTDAAFNIEAEINADWIESSGEREGRSFITGDSAVSPEGILVNADIPRFSSGIANDFTADNFFDLQGELKAGYDPIFLLNRRTIAKTRKLKGSDGQFLFAVASESMPATIGGDPFLSVIDMPDVAVDSEPIALGDWRKVYWIVDGVVVSVIRDPFSRKKDFKTEFTFMRRVGGKVVLPEGAIVLKIEV